MMVFRPHLQQLSLTNTLALRTPRKGRLPYQRKHPHVKAPADAKARAHRPLRVAHALADPDYVRLPAPAPVRAPEHSPLSTRARGTPQSEEEAWPVARPWLCSKRVIVSVVAC